MAVQHHVGPPRTAGARAGRRRSSRRSRSRTRTGGGASTRACRGTRRRGARRGRPPARRACGCRPRVRRIRSGWPQPPAAGRAQNQRDQVPARVVGARTEVERVVAEPVRTLHAVPEVAEVAPGGGRGIVRVLVIAGCGRQVRDRPSPRGIEVARVRGVRSPLVLVVSEQEHFREAPALDEVGGLVVLAVGGRSRTEGRVLARDVAGGTDHVSRRRRTAVLDAVARRPGSGCSVASEWITGPRPRARRARRGLCASVPCYRRSRPRPSDVPTRISSTGPSASNVARQEGRPMRGRTRMHLRDGDPIGGDVRGDGARRGELRRRRSGVGAASVRVRDRIDVRVGVRVDEGRLRVRLVRSGRGPVGIGSGAVPRGRGYRTRGSRLRIG